MKELLEQLIGVSEEIGYWGDMHDTTNQRLKDEYEKLLASQAKLKSEVLARITLCETALKKTIAIASHASTITIYGAIAEAMQAAQEALARED